MSAGRRLNRGEVIEKLRQLLADFPEVVFAVLFGSLATKGFSVHDVDIAVKVEAEDKYVILAKLVEEVSEVLGVEGGLIWSTSTEQTPC
jgi:predicted nucleotidyltransferase